MKINKKITKVNYTGAGKLARIQYIAIHFVGGVSTAKNNADYFYSEDRGASAHYFVDESEIWQVVEDKDIAWHVGATGYKHPHCRNTNSIGIEMCCKKDEDGQWYFEPRTVANTLDLVKDLMVKYNVPLDSVVRHYDVTGKNCPEPYVRKPKEWEMFKDVLAAMLNPLAPPSIEDCTQDMFWRGIITDRVLWNDIALQDDDIRWLLAKYYQYIRINGGSVKNPADLTGKQQAIEILRKQDIISEPDKWMHKATDVNIYWLLLKMADYIN